MKLGLRIDQWSGQGENLIVEGFGDSGRKEFELISIDKSFKELCCKEKERNGAVAGRGDRSGELLFFLFQINQRLHYMLELFTNMFSVK